ncbi:S8 family peptidase [Tumebacillus sp. DT12]|uniref:S8 family peptidase n=1 Tax=Tumebacillus lacus TaxID=2995335 RepID=A0ABT3X913_9BACL|nr:S8 family peptidase [Tumebacillus lacus]MCX7571249.1 S8 family peptidase [Tumebacillus lacus]
MKKTMISLLTAAALLTALAPVGVQAGSSAADTAQSVQAAKHADDRVLVKFKQGKQVEQALDKHGLKEFRTLGKGEWKLVKVPKGQAEEFHTKLQGDADVEAAELDSVHTMFRTPNDPQYSSQWHWPNIYAPQAWDITTGNSMYKIAIIDTGIDYQHPDLAGKLLPGYDFANNDSDADDDQGHGTHVAGTASALTNNANQVAGLDWNARLLPVKVLNASGSGYTSDIIDGLYFAADNGAHAVNMSLGGGGYSQAFQDAINYLWGRGGILVAAAGSSSTSGYSYPAAYNNVVAVAATTTSNTKASFSNYGTWVEVAAPGTNILSTANGGGTSTMSGTSMAAPQVAGLVTLVRSVMPGATNQAVIDRICNTADRITGTGTYWSCGKINAFRAVRGY